MDECEEDGARGSEMAVERGRDGAFIREFESETLVKAIGSRCRFVEAPITFKHALGPF